MLPELPIAPELERELQNDIAANITATESQNFLKRLMANGASCIKLAACQIKAVEGSSYV